MKTSAFTAGLVIALAMQGAVPDHSGAVALRQMGFEEMVRESSVIVQGRVVHVDSFWGPGAAPAARSEDAKASASPAVRPESGGPLPGAAPPVEVGTRGGRMIFTRVRMQTLQAVQGAPGGTVEFTIAGGMADGRIAVVPGMPTFDVGKTYMVFLRKGYLGSADPVTGVNQGFFRVVQDPQSGLEVMLAANADYVLGVENDRVVTRYNPQRIGTGPQAAGPPTPDHAGVQAQMSAEVQRYWHSTEPVMTVGEFVRAIRSRTRP